MSHRLVAWNGINQHNWDATHTWPLWLAVMDAAGEHCDLLWLLRLLGAALFLVTTTSTKKMVRTSGTGRQFKLLAGWLLFGCNHRGRSIVIGKVTGNVNWPCPPHPGASIYLCAPNPESINYIAINWTQRSTLTHTLLHCSLVPWCCCICACLFSNCWPPTSKQ